MNAEQIRKLVQEVRSSKTTIRERPPVRDVLLAEIAAQLAELNERLWTVIKGGEVAVVRRERS